MLCGLQDCVIPMLTVLHRYHDTAVSVFPFITQFKKKD